MKISPGEHLAAEGVRGRIKSKNYFRFSRRDARPCVSTIDKNLHTYYHPLPRHEFLRVLFRADFHHKDTPVQSVKNPYFPFDKNAPGRVY